MADEPKFATAPDLPKYGPNVRRLIIYRMSYDAIPIGTKDSIASGIKFLTDPQRMIQSSRDAYDFVMAMIKLIRTAAEPNPYKNADDETCAAEILRRVDERKATTQRPRTLAELSTMKKKLDGK